MKRNNRQFKTALALALVLALVMTLGALAAPRVIDAFDTPGPTITLIFDDPPTPLTGSGSAVGGIGGERDVVVDATATSVGDIFRSRVITSGATKLSISADASVRANTRIIWDGSTDVDATVVDPTGLGGENLADGTNDGFHVEVIYNDNPVQVIMHVWQNSVESTASINLPSGITINDHVDFFIPFASFSPALDFTNVGAIMLEINAVNSPGADLELDFLDADNFRDYGDAPNSYGAVAHIANGLRLGSNVDIEASPFYTPNADGDDLDQAPPNDEDGVSRTPGVNWTPTGTGSLDIIVNGCQQAVCYISGWIDWNSDGAFQPGERVFDDITYPNGSYSGALFPNLTFNVPPDVDFGGPILARFRICNTANICDTPIGEVSGGEVEDYAWSFGPTAVTLSAMSARSTFSTAALAAIGAAGMLALLSAYALLARRRSE